MITKARAIVVLVLLALTLGLGGVAAHADPPLDVADEITDTAGVLGASDRAMVQKALDDYQDETGFQLFVVYVKSFDGASGTKWAELTAKKSGLGTTETLLAVATDDRRYGTSVPTEHPISQSDFARIEADEIEPAIGRSDWAGAAIAAAEGYTDTADGSSLPWAAIVVGCVILATCGALLVHRVRRRYDDTHVVLDEHGEPVDAHAELSDGKVKEQSGADGARDRPNGGGRP